MSVQFEKLLIDFNKDIRDIKTDVCKTLCVEHYRELLKTLDFNINSNSDKFRWAQRYFNHESERMSWRTVAPGELKKTIRYNSKEQKAFVSYDTPYYSNKDLQNHFGSILGNRIKLKHEIPDGYEVASVNIQKVNNKTYGAVQNRNSDVLWLDIDNRNDHIAVEELKKFLNHFNISLKSIYYMEQNIFTGGIHAFVGLDTTVSDSSFYSDLELYLKRHNIHIECNFTNKVLRLPMSYEYMPIKITDNLKLGKEYIAKSNYPKTAKEVILNELFIPVHFEETFKRVLENDVEIVFETEKVNKYENYWNTPRCLFKRDRNSNIKSLSILPITKGNRFEITKKLVPFLKSQGYSVEDTAKIIKEHNYDSKDLSEWTIEQVINNITSFYNKCPTSSYKKIKSNNCPFISNEKYLSDDMNSLLSNQMFMNILSVRLSTNYLTVRNKSNSHQKKMTDNKLSILKQQMPYILKEVIGKMIYDIQTNKTFIDNKLQHLNGFQISDTFVIRMLKDINNKLGLNGRLSNYNIQYFKKALIMTLGLKEVITNTKRKWVKGSCISYIIKSIKDVINLIKKLVIINNQITSFIYNISIGNNKEKESVYEKNDYLMNYSTIPIPI